MSSLKNLYLLGYNVACAAGWAYVLITCAQHIVSGKSEQPQALYDEVEQVLKIVQTAAIMEVTNLACLAFENDVTLPLSRRSSVNLRGMWFEANLIVRMALHCLSTWSAEDTDGTVIVS